MQFNGYIEAETPKSILFWPHFWEKPDWFPKSQIDIVRYDGDITETTIKASTWICGQKKIKEDPDGN